MALPIEPSLPALARALHDGRSAVLQAPPGAGKTTRVPLALLDEAWLAGRRIVMLEPRRLAARAAARRMAELRGERVGETVGYRMRGDSRVGAGTRIEVVTEGVLTRMLADDPSLDGAGLVIFDEFHERSLNADLGLALALQAQAVLREDLRLLVMSATLDGAAVARLLSGAPIITSEGRSFPVQTRYLPRRAGRRLEDDVAAAVREALETEAGDILVFLPGAGEIRRVESLLLGSALRTDLLIAPLHGSLAQEAQDQALRPSPAGRRKIVLSTSIAQTSLTIEGIRVVIDAGLSRVPRFSARTGMTRLETVRVSRASAEQRRGRAGRLAAGSCYRLWGEAEESGFLPRDTPEILEADLAPVALDLAAAGVADPADLRWLDPPPAPAFASARALLGQLGACDAGGRITPRGRRMAALPLHPRLAHMLIEAEALNQGALACDLAALLGERDVLRGEGGPPHADLRVRLDLLHHREADTRFAGGIEIDRDALRRVRTEAAELRRRLSPSAPDIRADDAAGRILASAYPDRVAQRRPGPSARFLLRNGGGASLTPGDLLWDAEWLVVAETDGRRPEARIALACPVSQDEILAVLGDAIVREVAVEWDARAGAVVAHTLDRLGAILLRDIPLRDPPAAAVAAALLGGIRAEGMAALPWTDNAQRLRARVAFLRDHDPSWPDLSDAALLARLDEWLGPELAGIRRRDELRRVDLAAALLGILDWRQRAALDAAAPTHIQVPTGSRIPVDYTDPAAPALAVRLQELFGLADTPRIGGDRVPVILQLLSPAGRPVQITRDLAGFWSGSYAAVKKDLKGRYPRHYWPDDPLRAEPTRRVRPRG